MSGRIPTTTARLIPADERDGCSCGQSCHACGNCEALSAFCRWCNCDGHGRVPIRSGYEAQLDAEDVAERRRARGRR